MLVSSLPARGQSYQRKELVALIMRTIVPDPETTKRIRLAKGGGTLSTAFDTDAATLKKRLGKNLVALL